MIGAAVMPASSCRHADQRMEAARGRGRAPAAMARRLLLARRVGARRSGRGRRSPAAASSRRRRHAGNLPQRLAALVAARHAADQAARVGMQRRGPAPLPTGPVSTMRPAYITAMSSARPATTARSWVIQISAVPCSRASFCTSARICAWIVTSSAVVGSSAIDQVRAGAAARWRSPRAGACRRRTGADRRAAARPGWGCRPCRARRAPAVARLGRARPSSCACTASIICVSMRSTGFSVIIGSWKIIAMRLPRSARISRLRQPREVLALEQDRAAGDAAGRIDQADDGEAGDRSCRSRTRRPAPAPGRARR